MMCNPSPKISAAREIGQQFEFPVVIILMVNPENGNFELELATYGESRVEANLARELGDVAIQAVQAYLGHETDEGEESEEKTA